MDFLKNVVFVCHLFCIFKHRSSSFFTFNSEQCIFKTEVVSVFHFLADLVFFLQRSSFFIYSVDYCIFNKCRLRFHHFIFSFFLRTTVFVFPFFVDHSILNLLVIFSYFLWTTELLTNFVLIFQIVSEQFFVWITAFVFTKVDFVLFSGLCTFQLLASLYIIFSVRTIEVHNYLTNVLFIRPIHRIIKSSLVLEFIS